MEEYLDLSDDLDSQPNLDMELNAFFNFNHEPSNRPGLNSVDRYLGFGDQLGTPFQLAPKTSSGSEPPLGSISDLLSDTPMNKDIDYSTTTETPTPQFTYVAENFLANDCSLNEELILPNGINNNANTNTNNTNNTNNNPKNNFKQKAVHFLAKEGHFVRTNEESSQSLMNLNNDIFDGRRESFVSDTVTPINSRANSPRNNPLSFHNKQHIIQNNGVGITNNSMQSQQAKLNVDFGFNTSPAFQLNNDANMNDLYLNNIFPLSPLKKTFKESPKIKQRKTSSSSTSSNSSLSLPLESQSMKDKKCVFKPAPRKKSELYFRPERRCPKFEFGIRSEDNVVNVSFHGGFIRNTIMDWYFPPNSPLPTNFQDVTIRYDHQYYENILGSIDQQIRAQGDPNISTFRSYWKLLKTQVGPHIKLEFVPESLDCDVNFSKTQYYFNIVSRIVRPNSFGPIESGARYRAKMVNDMKLDDSTRNPRWCHFITSAEMKGILDFIFDGLDYIANDDTLPNKLAKGIKPNPFKQHESRIRSHMVGYVSGKKCMRNATNILFGERKVFAEEMYQQVIGYDDKKRPYNTLKEFAVMEVKYMMDNIEDLFEKFYWVDPQTVPPGGYKVRF